MTATETTPMKPYLKAVKKNGSLVMATTVPQRKKRVPAERWATAEECKAAGKQPGPMNV